MYADFWDSFWGTTVFFNVMMQKFYFAFAAVLLQKVGSVIDAKDEVHGVMYHLSFQFNIYFNFYRFLFLFG